MERYRECEVNNTKGKGGKKAEEKEKEGDASEAQAGQGRREEVQNCAALENIRGWNSGVPRTAEFMNYQELEETTLTKIPLLCGRLDKCPGSAALLFLLSELGQEVCYQLVLLVTSCPNHLRLQRQQELRILTAQTVNFLIICSLWLPTLSSALLKGDKRQS